MSARADKEAECQATHEGTPLLRTTSRYKNAAALTRPLLSPPAASASSSQRPSRAWLRLSGADVVQAGARFQGNVDTSHVCVDSRSGIESVTLDEDAVGTLGVRTEKHRKSTDAARPVCEGKKNRRLQSLASRFGCKRGRPNCTGMR